LDLLILRVEFVPKYTPSAYISIKSPDTAAFMAACGAANIFPGPTVNTWLYVASAPDTLVPAILKLVVTNRISTRTLAIKTLALIVYSPLLTVVIG
jgi:hypothetical protein